jgi:NAD+ synthase
MNDDEKINRIVSWIKEYATQSNKTSLVVGISGGIDSSVVSTLCALTGIETIVVSMPIDQNKELHDMSLLQGSWLTSKYSNVKHEIFDLSTTYRSFINSMTSNSSGLSRANTKSRIRMICLYHIASNNNAIVVGTGNKVEDFGIGFFTKYGDGGVDISPIADLLKTEVWSIGRKVNLPQQIINAPPTDGLWEDNRTDEEQIGASYEELEWAMNHISDSIESLTERQLKVRSIYMKYHKANYHKMIPIPVCKIHD